MDPPDPPAEPDAQVIAPDGPEPDAAPGPPMLVVDPPAGPVNRGQFVPLRANPANFLFVDPTSGAVPTDGQGHYHYYVDDDVAYTAGWTKSVQIRTSLSDAVGEHMIRFVLVDSIHEEITPLVETTIMYTLQ